MRPVVSQAAEDLYKILTPVAYADEANNWPLLTLCESLANPIQEVTSLSESQKVTGNQIPNVATIIENYIRNPSFEVNVTGWVLDVQGGTGALAQSNTVGGLAGTFAARVTATSAGVTSLGIVTNAGDPYWIPVIGGETWTITGYTRAAATPRNFRVTVGYYNAGGFQSAVSGTIRTNAVGSWTRANDLTVVIPAGITNMTVYIDVINPANGEIHYIDGMMANKFAGLPGYVDGNSGTGYSWEGTAHDSRTFRAVSLVAALGGNYPPWSQVVDINRSPAEALPWLAQFVGVKAPPQTTGETTQQYTDRLRTYIRSTPGFTRGSRQAMVAAAQQFLTGIKAVYFNERDTSAYHLTVSTRKLETPVEDWSATNLLTNGGFETNTTGWSVAGVGGIGRDVSGIPRFGKAFGTDSSSGAGNSDVQITGTISGATLNRVFTASIYVRGRLTTIGKTFTLFIQETGGASGAANSSATIALTDQWQRISISRTLTANDRTGVQLIARFVAAGGGEQIDIDGAQVEENPAASPYIETDGATASRTAGNGPVGAALRSQKPAGIVMVYQTINGQDWQNVVNTQAAWTNVVSSYATINALEAG